MTKQRIRVCQTAEGAEIEVESSRDPLDKIRKTITELKEEFFEERPKKKQADKSFQ